MQVLSYYTKLIFVFLFINNDLYCLEFYDLTCADTDPKIINNKLITLKAAYENREILSILNVDASLNSNESEEKKSSSNTQEESQEDDQEYYYSPVSPSRKSFIPTPENTPTNATGLRKTLKSESVINVLSNMSENNILAKILLKRNNPESKDKKANN